MATSAQAELVGPFLVSGAIAGQVRRDPKQPRFEPTCVLITTDAPYDPQEGLLKQILRCLAVAGQSVEQPVHAGRVQRYQPAECRGIVPLRPAEDVVQIDLVHTGLEKLNV